MRQGAMCQPGKKYYLVVLARCLAHGKATAKRAAITNRAEPGLPEKSCSVLIAPIKQLPDEPELAATPASGV